MNISELQKRFTDEALTIPEIAGRIEANKPSEGILKDKWTGKTIQCPVCGQESLDKFTGGVNVDPGKVEHTSAIYHCRVCGFNATQEELEKAG